MPESASELCSLLSLGVKVGSCTNEDERDRGLIRGSLQQARRWLRSKLCCPTGFTGMLAAPLAGFDLFCFLIYSWEHCRCSLLGSDGACNLVEPTCPWSAEQELSLQGWDVGWQGQQSLLPCHSPGRCPRDCVCVCVWGRVVMCSVLVSQVSHSCRHPPCSLWS